MMQPATVCMKSKGQINLGKAKTKLQIVEDKIKVFEDNLKTFKFKDTYQDVEKNIRDLSKELTIFLQNQLRLKKQLFSYKISSKMPDPEYDSKKIITTLAKEYGRIVTVEEGILEGGVGRAIIAYYD